MYLKTFLRTAIVCTGLVSLLNAYSTNHRSVSVLKTDACRKFCNNYTGLCMPDTLDPMNVYKPHCIGAPGEIPPSTECAHCVRARGLTPTTPKSTPALTTPSTTTRTTTRTTTPTTTTRTTTTTPTTTTTTTTTTTPPPTTTTTTEKAKSEQTFPVINTPFREPSVEPKFDTALGGEDDKCQKVCGNYSEICMPEWLVGLSTTQPFCGEVNNVGKPNASCLICLEAKSTAHPNHNKCDMECRCHRLVIITLEAQTGSCTADGQCIEDEFSMPKRHATDVSTCECEATSTCSTEESTSWTSTGYYPIQPPTEDFHEITSQNTNVFSEPDADRGKLGTEEDTTLPYTYFTTEPHYTEPETSFATHTDFFAKPTYPPAPEPTSTTECICPTPETTIKTTLEQSSEQEPTQYSVITDEEIFTQYTVITGVQTAPTTTESVIDYLNQGSSTENTSEHLTDDSFKYPPLPQRKPPVEEDFDYDDY